IQNEERFDNLSTKADILKALNRSDDAKTTWNQALKIATAQQLYSYGRQFRVRSRALKRWKSSSKSPNGFRTESTEVWLKPASSLQQAISQARLMTPSRHKLPLQRMLRSRASRR